MNLEKMWIAKDGRPLSTEEASPLLHDRSYKIVRQVELPKSKLVVSTVWLGLDHQFGDGPPLIFETMVFSNWRDFDELDCRRYPTEEDARKGHFAVVDEWMRKRPRISRRRKKRIGRKKR